MNIVIDQAQEDIRKQEESIYNYPELSIEQKFQALLTVNQKLLGPLSDRIYDDLRHNYRDERHKVTLSGRLE